MRRLHEESFTLLQHKTHRVGALPAIDYRALEPTRFGPWIMFGTRKENLVVIPPVDPVLVILVPRLEPESDFLVPLCAPDKHGITNSVGTELVACPLFQLVDIPLHPPSPDTLSTSSVPTL